MIKINNKTPKKQSPTQFIGTRAEEVAKQFLLAKGLKFIRHQYRVKCGEIDLIMQDKTELVFVEVRSKENANFCEPQETVTHAKQRRLIRTALYFQQCHPWLDHLCPRFDIVAILGGQLNFKINWFPNAFGLD